MKYICYILILLYSIQIGLLIYEIIKDLIYMKKRGETKCQETVK